MIISRLLILIPALTVAATACAAAPDKIDRGKAMSHSNRLAGSSSPYLLQHADNPVDWWPWSDEAFDAAREQDTPIFLSIGYSTCHWCHVMAHESFENDEVAALMNETFINIKVDREERPDIDRVYMTVTQMLTGSGGWPMTIIMTPDKKPFFAATYIPRETRFRRMGMLELIPKIRAAWNSDRAALVQSAGEIVGALETGARRNDSGTVDPKTVVAGARRELDARYDAVEGGFGGAPKFPSPHTLLFLLAAGEVSGERRPVEMATHTLEMMRRGGIFDQIGFGFHRYSTDREWLVPHFEKMLYDQALLLMTFTEASRVAGRADFARAALEIVEYIERDLGAPGGAFFSAEDADSEGEEGVFYLWTEKELQTILGKEDAALVHAVWNTSPTGNILDETSPKASIDNILHLEADLDSIAENLGRDREELDERLQRIRRRLLEIRSLRPRPLLDDKILTDWNGLTAAALARAGVVLFKPDLIDRARRVIDFIDEHLRDSDGRLLHRFRAGQADIPAFLDDHVFFQWALLELYDATLEPRYLRRALESQATIDRLFWDEETGGYFFSPSDGEVLLVRSKEVYDGAIPSGNSVATHNLVRLSRLTGEPQFETRADELVTAFGQSIRRSPSAHTHLVDALLRATTPSFEIVVCGPRDDPQTLRMIGAVRDRAPARSSLLLIEPGAGGDAVRKLAPFTEFHAMVDDLPTAYVCRNHRCARPTTRLEILEHHLEERPVGPGKGGDSSPDS